MRKCEEVKRAGVGLSLEAGLGRPACCTSHRRFLCQECDPFYIHTSIQSRNALSMRMIRSAWGGEGHVSVIFTLFWNQCVCVAMVVCAAVWGLCLSWQGESVTVKANVHMVNEVKLCYMLLCFFNWTDSSATIFSQVFLRKSITTGQEQFKSKMMVSLIQVHCI